MLQTINDPVRLDVYPGHAEVADLIKIGKNNEFCRDMVVRTLSRIRNMANTHGMDPYVELYTEALEALDVPDCDSHMAA